jgi:hypothetical protein
MFSVMCKAGPVGAGAVDAVAALWPRLHQNDAVPCGSVCPAIRCLKR